MLVNVIIWWFMACGGTTSAYACALPRNRTKCQVVPELPAARSCITDPTLRRKIGAEQYPTAVLWLLALPCCRLPRNRRVGPVLLQSKLVLIELYLHGPGKSHCRTAAPVLDRLLEPPDDPSDVLPQLLSGLLELLERPRLRPHGGQDGIWVSVHAEDQRHVCHCLAQGRLRAALAMAHVRQRHEQHRARPATALAVGVVPLLHACRQHAAAQVHGRHSDVCGSHLELQRAQAHVPAHAEAQPQARAQHILHSRLEGQRVPEAPRALRCTGVRLARSNRRVKVCKLCLLARPSQRCLQVRPLLRQDAGC
mmetsp:Transcript_20155/g.41785  ORF Transcript_20155/g.41785 Transcript_20155/m.41785 type:complete len:309 (-) Transcript_20155:131-1057(-)